MGFVTYRVGRLNLRTVRPAGGAANVFVSAATADGAVVSTCMQGAANVFVSAATADGAVVSTCMQGAANVFVSAATAVGTHAAGS